MNIVQFERMKKIREKDQQKDIKYRFFAALEYILTPKSYVYQISIFEIGKSEEEPSKPELILQTQYTNETVLDLTFQNGVLIA